MGGWTSNSWFAGDACARHRAEACSSVPAEARGRSRASPLRMWKKGVAGEFSCLMLGDTCIARNGIRQGLGILLSVGVEVDDAALQADCDGMSPVVRAKLGEYVRYMALNGCLAN